MFTSSIFLEPFFHSNAQITTGTSKWENLGFNKSSNFTTNPVLSAKGFKLNCLVERETNVGTSSLEDGAAGLLNEEVFVEEKTGEPGISTMVMNFENKFDPYGAVNTPLYQTATFTLCNTNTHCQVHRHEFSIFNQLPSAIENGPYDYTRSGNPTRHALESLPAKLDKADRALCFTSGMAALSEEIVAGDDMYGGSDRLLSQVLPKRGVVVKRVNTCDLNEVASAIGPRTKLVWLESPTNPRLQISDIRKIAEIAHAHGVLVLVDNSIMSPVLYQPLELGADIVMHSATKFIAGHSDLMAGVLAVKGERLGKELYFLQNAEGSGLAPFDTLLARNQETLSYDLDGGHEFKNFEYSFFTCKIKVFTLSGPTKWEPCAFDRLY